MSMQDTFLLDEVRCGFMIPAAVKQAWAAQLEVLKEIDRVCKKHNIQYFADWGTLLGTVRHGGFIPWDDDFDIVMKREDYIKFMTVARFDMDEGFDVQTFRNHEDCWLFMGKVVGRNGFCFEKEHLRRFHNFPYIACVDVFVLDYVYRDPKKEQERRELCLYMLAVADSIVESKMTRADIEQRMRMLEEKSGRRFNRMEDPVELRRYLYGEMEKVFAKVPECEADKLTQLFPFGLKGDRFQFPKEYYAEAVELPFEYTSMPIPKMYDKMLHQKYGNYLRLVKTAGAHDYPFFEAQKKNLQKVLDFELPEFKFDADKLFRNEEELACKNLSYKSMAQECVTELWRMKDELILFIRKMPDDPACTEQALDLLAASQQLAIDLGNMLEQFLGEGCSIIPLLEQYCEVLYGIYEQISQETNAGEATDEKDVSVAGFTVVIVGINELQKAIEEDMKRNVFERKTILFLPVLAKDWNGMQSLWQECVDNPLNDVYVVPLPYFYKDYDGSSRRVCYEANDFPEDVQALDYNLMTSEYMEMLHPEIIVIQNPYDSWNPAISVPEMYHSLNLRKYTDELIYVPPFAVEEYTKSNEREYFNMRYYVTMPGVVYADRIIVQSEKIREVYIERLSEFAGENTKQIWEKRVSVCNRPYAEQKLSVFCKECTEKAEEAPAKKKMIYGISLGAYNVDEDTAQNKIECNLQLFKECAERIEVTIAIFPYSADSELVKEYMERVSVHYPGVIADIIDAMGCHIEDYDAYYGDIMPLVMEFRECEKPVMIQDYLI